MVYHHHSATAQHGQRRKLYLVGRNRVRTLAKNATAGMLLVNGPWMLVYDAAYVVFASLSGRTLAPLRGRARGLREWRRYRRSGRPHRRPCGSSACSGFRRALQRHKRYTETELIGWVGAEASASRALDEARPGTPAGA